MKTKPPDELEEFNKVMDGLLAVPYSELQKKLEEEKQAKEKEKGRKANPSPSSRASSSRKKPVG